MAMQLPTKKKRLPSLPQDLIELILVRLPVSDLLRCRGVCKQWDGIIRDPHFTMAHLRHARPRPLLFFQRGRASGKSFPSEAVLFDEAWSPSTRDVPVIDPDDFLCASCNGLVCLYSSNSTIKIANLATGESMHLAKPVKDAGDQSSFYSFGFSPATNEYKILHFLRGQKPHPAGGSFSVIQVYTLGDDKWRDVRTLEVVSLYCVKQSGVANVDGAMYWLTHDKESNWRRDVISFDLRDECLELIRLPKVDFADPAFANPFCYWITEIDSKVSVAAVQARRDSLLARKLHIWTLDNKQDSPHRRLNWVEQRRVTDMLESHADSLDAPWKVLVQTVDAFSSESKKMIPAADQAKQRNYEESEAGPSRPKRKRKPSSRFDSSTWTT